MKRVLLIVVSTFLLALGSHAQGNFCISGGVASPLGEFASKNVVGDGYAKSGNIFAARIDNYFPSGIGMGLVILKHQNSIDMPSLATDLRTTGNYKFSNILSSSSHKEYSALALGVYKILDREAFTLDFSIGAGAALNHMSVPAVIGVGPDGIANRLYKVDYNSKISFAYNTGVRFVYYMSSSLGLAASVSYFSTNPSYSMSLVSNDIANKEYSKTTFHTNNQILDLSIGLVFGK